MRKETLKIKKTNTGFDDEMAKETKQERARDLHITGKRKNLHSPGRRQKKFKGERSQKNTNVSFGFSLNENMKKLLFFLIQTFDKPAALNSFKCTKTICSLYQNISFVKIFSFWAKICPFPKLSKRKNKQIRLSKNQKVSRILLACLLKPVIWKMVVFLLVCTLYLSLYSVHSLLSRQFCVVLLFTCPKVAVWWKKKKATVPVIVLYYSKNILVFWEFSLTKKHTKVKKRPLRFCIHCLEGTSTFFQFFTSTFQPLLAPLFKARERERDSFQTVL